MKVLLKKDVYNLGYAGEVFEVAPGYGRNYLIPQGFAVKATPSMLKQANVWRKQAEARRAELKAEYEILASRIRETTLTFIANAGETGKLYGSITTTQVAEKLNETLGTDIDSRKVGTGTLRQLGEHKVVVRLSAEFQPEVTVVVESEDEVSEEVVAEEVEADATATEEEAVEDVELVEETA